MATTVVHTIKASGGDYTSLSAWEAAQQRNLVTLDEISVAECYGFVDTTIVTISGWTTGINNYIIIQAHPSARATMPITRDGSRYFLQVSPSVTAVALTVSQQYTKVYDIQIENTSNASNTFGVFPSSNVTFRNCIVSIPNGAACWFFQGGGGNRLQNCVGITKLNGTNSMRCFRHDNAPVQYDNCAAIFSDNGVGFFVNTTLAQGIIFRNCLSINMTKNANCFIVAGTGLAGTAAIDLVKSTNNVSNDGTALGANSRLNQRPIFANASIGDFHLDWMDPVAQRSGVDLSASDTGSFNDDFDGNIRTTPWHAGPLRVINSPNGIQLGNIGNSNIRLSSTGTSPITIR